MEKRYAIVRVDDTCPSGHDGCKVNLVCVQDRNNLKEKFCRNCFYGDTKEQLIKKVAQIRFKQETQYGSKDMLKAVYNMCYRQAREIVEFLGLEDD